MVSSQPLLESDLIFSSAATSLKYALGELKRSNLTIINRLHSIKGDADFVQRVATAYDLPLIANERCGSWYIPPNTKSGSAYFKSTDGHFGQWSFSLRRLNLPILDIVGQHGGCIIVDSTRRGKSMPDALSKTVPIWTAVLNRLLFPDNEQGSRLCTPTDVVSASEHSQIEARLNGFVDDVRSLGLDLNELRTKLGHRPICVDWIRANESLSSTSRIRDHGNLILLCTASSRDSHERAPSEYVQGAADDSESWAHGLDAVTFWEFHEQLLSTSEDDLPATIAALIGSSPHPTISRAASLIKPTANLWIGDNSTAEQMHNNFDLLIVCVPETEGRHLLEKPGTIHLSCSTGKVGSRQLRTELPKLDNLEKLLQRQTRVLITCKTGKDIAVGVSLAILCKYFDQMGCKKDANNQSPDIINKIVIKHRLSWIMVSMPDATPSRATLQSVNAYLMG